MKAMMDGFNCPPREIQAIVNRFYRPRAEIRAMPDGLHCPPDEIHSTPGRINAKRDRINAMHDRIHAVLSRINAIFAPNDLPPRHLRRVREDQLWIESDATSTTSVDGEFPVVA